MAQTPALLLATGSTVDHTPGSAVIAGQVIVTGSIPMIAGQAIAASVKGSLETGDQWKVPQAVEAITAGDAVYWDADGTPVTGTALSGAATATASGNTLMGECIETTVNTDTYVKILLTASKRTATVAGSILADAVTGSDATLDIAGLAAAQGGLVSVTGGVSSTAGNVGGVASLVGGVGGATANGGAVVITGGLTAVGATGTGGDVTIAGGANANTTNGAGGGISIDGGLGKGTGDGGAGAITGGVSGSGATGAGGAIVAAGGAAASNNGEGGLISSTGGAGFGTENGGAASLVGGDGGATGDGGAIAVTGGDTVAGATGTGGAVAIAGGANANTTNGAGGGVTIAGGAGKGTGVGGAASLSGGAAAGSVDGGNVVLTGGTSGSGVAGGVVLRGDTFFAQDAPTAEATGAQSIAAADFVNGIVVHSVAAASALSTPTGAQIAAVLPTGVTTGDAFYLHVITIGTGADDISTLTAGDGQVTFVGNVTVGPDAAGTSGFGTWIFRMTGATSFIGYRVG